MQNQISLICRLLVSLHALFSFSPSDYTVCMLTVEMLVSPHGSNHIQNMHLCLNSVVE